MLIKKSYAAQILQWGCKILHIKTPVTLIIHAGLPWLYIAVSFPYWLQPQVYQTRSTVLHYLDRKAVENNSLECACLSFIYVSVYCTCKSLPLHLVFSLSALFNYNRVCVCVCVCKQEWSPSHNLKSLKKKQMAAREAMARQTVSDAEQSSVESSVIRSEF